ncbi:MAG: hypothetical protein IM600_17105 [Bacteroidetes bacterium]|nr:hypothetical protein [Bacteroidota bacterium]MCA6445150.1 hypothetical protein [Bacteroidota bacterium]
MENNLPALWQNNDAPNLPKKIVHIKSLVKYGLLLSAKDQTQIVSTFNNEHYEMVSSFVWTKAINTLRSHLSKMGISFIAEMLDRPDINESANLQQAISEYEAIQLAEQLGIINGTIAFRLKKASETVAHFNSIELDDGGQDEMSEEECKSIIRACIEGILGYNKIEAAIDFKNFRQDLEETTLPLDSPYIIKIVQSPYFFHKTTIRIILSLIKSTNGAQLENTLANANLLIPSLWNSLKQPEKWQIGRCYAELSTDGKTKASSGLKQVLLKVRGFDFVPEDLRSTSFIKIGNEILVAHQSRNNYYNEPAPVNTLYKMGSVIPMPAFSICITAVMSVRLGNYWGVCNVAQDNAKKILKSISPDRWRYFFNECLINNEIMLDKLSSDRPLSRWMELFPDELLDELISESKEKDITNILKYTRDKDFPRLQRLASNIYNRLVSR